MAHIGKDIAARALEHDDGGDGDGRGRRKKKKDTEDDADDATRTTDGPTAGALPPLRESASRQERRRTARIRMLRVGRVGVTKSGFTEAPRLVRLSFGQLLFVTSLQSLSLQPPPSELPQSQSLPFSTTFKSPERIHEKRAKDREAAYFRRVQIARKKDRFPKLQFD